MSGLRSADPRLKALGLGLLVAILAFAAWLLPRIPQPPAYHQFVDQSMCFGISHCFDVSSNLPITLAGLAGLGFLASVAGRRAFLDQREALPYALFFFAAMLAGLGSAYYHLAPDNGRLVWDRAAIALALMAWFAAILCERVSIGFGLRLLPWLVAAGLGSAFYWGWSETHGMGDLRAYGLMQLYSLLLIPLLLWLYPPRYSGDRDILAVIGLYLLALLCDLSDRSIATLTSDLVSGHTLKHLLAAGAAFWVAIRLKRRHPL